MVQPHRLLISSDIYKRKNLLLLLLSRCSRVRLCATPQTAVHQAPRPWDSPGKNTGVGCHFLLQYMKVKSEREVAQSCPTLCGSLKGGDMSSIPGLGRSPGGGNGNPLQFLAWEIPRTKEPGGQQSRECQSLTRLKQLRMWYFLRVFLVCLGYFYQALIKASHPIS